MEQTVAIENSSSLEDKKNLAEEEPRWLISVYGDSGSMQANVLGNKRSCTLAAIWCQTLHDHPGRHLHSDIVATTGQMLINVAQSEENHIPSEQLLKTL